MRILIVIPRQPRETGNRVTAERFRSGLRRYGHQLRLIETGPEDPSPINAALARFRPDCVLLLHAYRCGRPWLRADQAHLPYAVLLTGTDHFVDRLQPDKQQVVGTVLRHASAVLTQNRQMLEELKDDPGFRVRLHLLPVTASLGNIEFDLAARIGRQPDEPVLLLPAGIRPVKRNLELLLLCDRLVAAGFRFRLVLCGPELDRDYAARLQAALSQRPWAVWLGCIAQPAMASLMRQADLVLNHSLAEGVSNTLVEAQSLGRPVLAYANSGNRQVIEPGIHGLLYGSDEEFVEAAGRLLGDSRLRESLSRPPGDLAGNREAEVLESILSGMVCCD